VRPDPPDKAADQFSRGAGQPKQGAIGPCQARGKIRSQHIAGRSEGEIGRIFRQRCVDRLSHAAEQRLVLHFRCARHQDHIRLWRLKQERNGATTEQGARVQSEVAQELRHLQRGVHLQREGD